MPLSALRDSGLSFWRHLEEEDEAGLGELTFSSGSAERRAHRSVLGLGQGQSLLKETTSRQKLSLLTLTLVSRGQRVPGASTLALPFT